MAERKERPDKPIAGSWLLLKNIRQILAGPGSEKAQLQEVVAEIAAFMEAEVCSFYLCHFSGKLELYANTGLSLENRPQNIFLKEGQGLVGFIAETGELLNVADAASHLAFSHLPDISEENFRAFMGIPVLKEGKTLGVLVVQNRFDEKYSRDAEETLQTAAMMLGGLLSSETLRSIIEGDTAESNASETRQFSGDPLFHGIAFGTAVLHEPRVLVTRLVSDHPDKEVILLDQALKRLTVRIDDLLASGDLSEFGEHRDVLEAYKMYAHDRGWVKRLHHHIRNGATAEAAVGRVQSETKARFLRQSDPFFKERLHDLDELSHRLLQELAGKTGTAARTELPDNTILFACGMGPTALLDYDRTRLSGLVLEEGGTSSHVAVVARALGIPALGGVRGVITHIEVGDKVIIDADEGIVHVRPVRKLFKAYQNRVSFHESLAAEYEKLKDKPAVSKDNIPVSLMVNLGLEINFPHVTESGADGVGLFRTELEFMLSTQLPDFDTQLELYKRVYEASDGKPVTFRTLDIGGDKLLPYLDHKAEENPEMGWRAIRMSLDRPDDFKVQIQALLQASSGRELNILIPMISDVSEFIQARALIMKEMASCKNKGKDVPDKLNVGAMIEVPSILWQLDILLEHTDFISVGTNDLIQFLFAADRANVRVAHRYDPLNISVLRALKRLLEKVEGKQQPITICGELASSSIEVLALLGLGYRSFSMAPASIALVKSLIMSVEIYKLEQLLDEVLESGVNQPRDRLQAWLEKEAIKVR